MKLPKSLEAWGTPDFAGELAEELSEQRREFPFEDYLRSGGWVADNYAEFAVESFQISGKVIQAKCVVCFDEEVPGACRDRPTSEDRRGSFTLQIDTETGEGSAERDYESPLYSGENY